MKMLSGLLLCGLALAQHAVIPVWPDQPPGSESWNRQEVEYRNPRKERMVRNVVRPSLTVYKPAAAANGTGIVIAPGGGFHFLSWDSEGTQLAEWLAARGVTSFVLKYRLVDTGATEEEFQKKTAALMARLRAVKPGAAGPALSEEMTSVQKLAEADGAQAVKVVRQRAAEFGLATDRIGIIGFSAGGRVTMGAVLAPDPASRPNFAAPVYGGTVPDGVEIPTPAPPLFILCAADDSLASLSMPATYTRWRSAGHSAELHIYSKGGHGFGMQKRGLPVDHWVDRFGDWLETLGVLRR